MKKNPYIKVELNQKTKEARISRNGTKPDLFAISCIIIETLARDCGMSCEDRAGKIAEIISEVNSGRKGDNSSGVL